MHPLVEKQSVGQADVHELALGFAAVGGAAVGFLPALAGPIADVERARIVMLAKHDPGGDFGGAQGGGEQR